MTEVVDVVVRCRNEMPEVPRALAALACQARVRARVLFIDCHSGDGSREAAQKAGARIHDWDPAAYVPGQVLNHGMRETESSLVAFVNADAIAQDDQALCRLLAPLHEDCQIAASYARQLPRPEADQLTKLDYRRAFGDAPMATRFGAFFSMAASAIRREVWRLLPFDPNLRYSEDVDWVNRVQALGWKVRYVSEARFVHSNPYPLRGHFERRAGEGRADTLIHRLGPPSLMRDLARPLAGMLWRDARAGVVSPKSQLMRALQATGYYRGRRQQSRT